MLLLHSEPYGRILGRELLRTMGNVVVAELSTSDPAVNSRDLLRGESIFALDFGSLDLLANRLRVEVEGALLLGPVFRFDGDLEALVAAHDAVSLPRRLFAMDLVAYRDLIHHQTKYVVPLPSPLLRRWLRSDDSTEVRGVIQVHEQRSSTAEGAAQVAELLESNGFRVAMVAAGHAMDAVQEQIVQGPDFVVHIGLDGHRCPWKIRDLEAWGIPQVQLLAEIPDSQSIGTEGDTFQVAVRHEWMRLYDVSDSLVDILLEQNGQFSRNRTLDNANPVSKELLKAVTEALIS